MDARYAADNAGQPEARNLAAQMLTSQTTESQLMREMLAARGAQPRNRRRPGPTPQRGETTTTVTFARMRM